MTERIQSFRNRLSSGDPLIGTFIKTPSSIVCEVLARTALDVFCIDTEHAPFGRLEVDRCVAAFRMLDAPALVRVASDSPHDIRAALDCGATGVLVPHVITADQASDVVRAAHFGDGGRGYAGSSRAAEFTRKGMADHLSDSAAETTVVVQIEDLAALKNVREIASVEGVNALFVGRADLAVSMGKSPMDEEVVSAVRQICDDARAAGTTVGMFTPDYAEIPAWRERGASLFLLSSDQSFMLEGANQLESVLSR